MLSGTKYLRLFLITCLILVPLSPTAAQEQEEDRTAQETAQQTAIKDSTEKQLLPENRSPARDFLDNHRDKIPPDLPGGPLEIRIKHDYKLAYAAYPSPRKLDEGLFGTPGSPRMLGGAPMAYGVPLDMRTTTDDGLQYASTSFNTHYSSGYLSLPSRGLRLTARDATAIDGARTKDRVDMQATWADHLGNLYTVKCCHEMLPYGVQYPSFGGVVTNHILHGFTRIGTPLYPTVYAYFGFWGMGELWKNAKVVERNRLIHGMLTEYAWKGHKSLAFDKDVNPDKLMFYLVVPPVKPNPEKGIFEPAPVNTEFTIPNGEIFNVWSLMYDRLDYSIERVENKGTVLPMTAPHTRVVR